jgi:transcriptional regulator with XRE-family HTH domain
MAKADDPSALARRLRAIMQARDIGQKKLALMAGVNETYVRDILKGKSRSPQAAKLSAVAAALGLRPSDLVDVGTTTEPGELVSDAAELVLLTTWRKLSEQEREGVLDFIAFRLAQAAAGVARPSGKNV